MNRAFPQQQPPDQVSRQPAQARSCDTMRSHISRTPTSRQLSPSLTPQDSPQLQTLHR
jgi:hypothetical protein